MFSGDVDVYFSYGADMDHAQKSRWRTLVHERMQGTQNFTCYILVGGDDNVCFCGRQGKYWAWESDVTACDQSHSGPLVGVMLSVLRGLGITEGLILYLRRTYTRAIRISGIKVQFKKPQLHTGHPQTSVANSFLVGLISIYLMVTCPAKLHFSALEFEKFAFNQASLLGMCWKVESHEDFSLATFHKGCWLRVQDAFLWMNLPSTVWKMGKARTNCRIPKDQMALRLAFNCYQKLISPQFSVVTTIAHRQGGGR